MRKKFSKCNVCDAVGLGEVRSAKSVADTEGKEAYDTRRLVWVIGGKNESTTTGSERNRRILDIGINGGTCGMQREVELGIQNLDLAHIR